MRDLTLSISVFWAMVRKEFIVLTRYPVGFVASFGSVFFMVAILVLAGLTFGGSTADLAAQKTSAVAVYGFVLFLFLNDTLWTIGFNVRHEQVQGTLEQLYLSPASKFASLVARVTHLLLWTGLLSLAAVGMMVLMFGRLPVRNISLGLYLLFMTLSGTFGVGFAFAAVTLRLREGAQTLANLLQFTFLILCANFFPFSALPPALRAVSRIIPLAYGVDAFRSTLMGFPAGFPELASIQAEILIVTLFGLLMPPVGYFLYRIAAYQARQFGTLSIY